MSSPVENSSASYFPQLLTSCSTTFESNFGQPAPEQNTPAPCLLAQPRTKNQCLDIILVENSSPSSGCKFSTDPTTLSLPLSPTPQFNFGQPTLEHNTPAPCSPLQITNDIGYEPVRVGRQKRKPTQLPADSSASDISITFSPKKKAKSSKKIDHLADELLPYQQILSKLSGRNINEYQMQMIQLMQTLKKKGFLSPENIDLITIEVQLWTSNVYQ